MSGEEDTDRILWLVLNVISCVTWLTYRSHHREGNGSNFLTTVTYSSQSSSKLHVQKINYVPNPPIELAHYVISTRTRFCWDLSRSVMLSLWLIYPCSWRLLHCMISCMPVKLPWEYCLNRWYIYTPIQRQDLWSRRLLNVAWNYWIELR